MQGDAITLSDVQTLGRELSATNVLPVEEHPTAGVVPGPRIRLARE
jgi:hypothetical protein